VLNSQALTVDRQEDVQIHAKYCRKPIFAGKKYFCQPGFYHGKKRFFPLAGRKLPTLLYPQSGHTASRQYSAG